MDDGLVNPAKNILFGKYWNTKTFKEFSSIIDKSAVLLSISEGMSTEYLKRYGKVFTPFHNPIDTSVWLPNTKKDFSLSKDIVRILYAGRIGHGMSYSIVEFAEFIHRYNQSEKLPKIVLELLNPPMNEENECFFKQLNTLDCVNIVPSVKYDDLATTFSSADFLLLPIDFIPKHYHYVKYSMPTKASEYMISGAPVILFCDPNVSLYTHAKEHEWAYTIDKNDFDTFLLAINKLIENQYLREKISTRAVEFAKTKLDANIVRQSFREIINNGILS